MTSGPGPRGEATIVEPTPAERAVARRVAESRATVPHLELSVAAPRPGELSTAALVRACAQALTEHPRVNAAYRDGRCELYPRINIGVVLALEEAYVIPTIFDAATRGMDELARELDRLRHAARADGLRAADLSGATFTLWNAGEQALAQASLPVVAPQAGLLTAGTSALTLACDHRILYGAPAARFLSTVSRRLEAEAA